MDTQMLTKIKLLIPVLLISINNLNLAVANNDKYSNVGLAGISSELKNKFPICEKQLIVNWINKEKRIGISEFDTYNIKENYIYRFKSFVDLNPPYLSYKRVAYYPRNQNDGKQNLISNRKNGNPYFPYFVNKQRLVNDNIEELTELIIKHGLKFYTSEESKNIEQIVTGIRRLSLTNNSSTVCVIFPDKIKAWVVELKHIKNTHTKEQIDSLYEKVRRFFANDRMYKWNPKAHRKLFNTLSAYDLNNDGQEDYFNSFSAYYSKKSGDGSIGYNYKKFFMGCETNKHSTSDSQITTDGHSFHSKGCHLNEFLSN